MRKRGSEQSVVGSEQQVLNVSGKDLAHYILARFEAHLYESLRYGVWGWRVHAVLNLPFCHLGSRGQRKVIIVQTRHGAITTTRRGVVARPGVMGRILD